MTLPFPFPERWMSDSQDREMAAVYEDIKPDLDKVEDQLEAWARSENPLTAEVSRYILRKRGKRLRPALVILTSRLFTPWSEENVFLASLVELVHTASLIHDDIVDKAEVRRGAESVHARWGPNVTVLLGDHLYIKSIGLSLQSKHDRVIRLLAEVSARMIEGELNEYAVGGDLGVSEERYLGIIEDKTAVLFSACCRMGAVLGQASPDDENAIADYGTNLGLCFQIVDDLLDFTGSEKTLGKPVLSDLAEGRVTLPLIRALQGNGRPHRDEIAALIRRRDIAAGEKDRLLHLLSMSGALDYTAAKAREFSEKAAAILGRFPESGLRQALAALARFVLGRNR